MKHKLLFPLALAIALLPPALRAEEGAGGHYMPGATASFITKVGKVDLAAEVKWLPELNVQKRLKGDTIWFKLGVVF